MGKRVEQPREVREPEAGRAGAGAIAEVARILRRRRRLQARPRPRPGGKEAAPPAARVFPDR